MSKGPPRSGIVLNGSLIVVKRKERKGEGNTLLLTTLLCHYHDLYYQCVYRTRDRLYFITSLENYLKHNHTAIA